MMKEFLKVIPIFLYFIVGIISLVMAFKGLFSSRFLPFHEKAAGKSWNEIEHSFKEVILLFLRLTGLGFLILSILLIVFPVIDYFIPNSFYKYSIPFIGLVYCLGLLIFNYILHKNTKAETPWKGSLYAMLLIGIGIILSIFN